MTGEVQLKVLAIALGALLTASCQQVSEPSAEQNVTRLMQACGETDRLLGQMKAAETSFQYDEAGNARISRSLWETIPTGMQDALINAIAYRAICASGEPGELVVTIRNSDNREILAQETVTEFDR
jgi:hypothetical protein